MPDDYALLNLGGLTSLIKNVKVSRWGTMVAFECIYDPTGERSPYILVFEDCREIKWNVHDPEEAEDVEADLFGIHLGENAHRKPALIHTDIFEISLLYGKFHLQKAAVHSTSTTVTLK
ncbi:hypothetical protein G7B40_017095 [Aetokthonos hydrillicola Thurmond2011]|jgi:hypothetical protein|uniref:Uncharacterized protein n=1 Tax=Aetokthonos hydrillicola Thurmond2011 TaxID=2712845 RepID=A0AAP5IAN0_9CYAN|nr:hypothetical protein [Aetokthonos hydrillicola]MBO3463704.1 hypothetical protein [Aetokthonos hydrillicola CCALA 1050]MBW4588590.1 hypothetical protein [Aetokthonos hydrillicola CCALA 1050]MDR9896263.1 hypothetical protein [Aetokthonos hydrillicola Thurmond2011]